MSRRNPATGGLTGVTFVKALGEEMRKSWPTIRFIARLERRRNHVRRGRVIRTERETIYLITSLPGATPKRIMSVNRSHWRIEAFQTSRTTAIRFLAKDHNNFYWITLDGRLREFPIHTGYALETID